MESIDNQVEFIAKACHEANRVWCQANGDDTQKHWQDAEQWQRESAIKGVEFRLNNPGAGEDSQHNAWMADKVNDGWVHGEVKDAEKKTHPCIVPFKELPEFQQKKDALFCAIVDTLKVSVKKQSGSGQTFGEKSVGLSFNPSNDDEVSKAKKSFAVAIDQLNLLRSKTESGEVKRLCSVAITESQSAQMWAVKAITWKD